MAAVGFLVSGVWPHESANLPIIVFREITLGAIGCIGFFAAWITLGGVRVSRKHIDRIKADWRRYDSRHEIVPEMAPHTFGYGPAIAFGSKYAVLIPVLMLLVWAAYLAAYLAVLGPQLWSNICDLVDHYPKAFPTR